MDQTNKPTITNQEIFDISARHLLTQKARSVIQTAHGNSCAYRGANGKQCAAGPFLLDSIELDSKGRNSQPFDMVKDHYKYDLTESNITLVLQLQGIHDNWHTSNTSDTWPDKLRQLAIDAKLSAAVVDEVSP